MPNTLWTRKACLMLKSSMISSDPPGMAYARTSRYNLRSISRVSQDLSSDIPFDLSSLTTSTVAQASEDLACLACAKLKGHRGLSLESCNRTTQNEAGLGIRHLIALEDQVFHPVEGGFDLACHMRKLEPYDRMVDKAFPKGASLMSIFHGFFVANAREAYALDDYTHPLMIEVGHDDLGELADERKGGRLIRREKEGEKGTRRRQKRAEREPIKS